MNWPVKLLFFLTFGAVTIAVADSDTPHDTNVVRWSCDYQNLIRPTEASFSASAFETENAITIEDRVDSTGATERKIIVPGTGVFLRETSLGDVNANTSQEVRETYASTSSESASAPNMMAVLHWTPVLELHPTENRIVNELERGYFNANLIIVPKNLGSNHSTSSFSMNRIEFLGQAHLFCRRVVSKLD